MRSLLLFAFTIPTFAQLAVTPNQATVTQGQSLTFTSNLPVKWSLAPGNSGTLTVISPTSAAYLAPPIVAPQGVAGGCQTTPSDSVFNTRIDNLPIEARSTTWTAAMNPVGLSIQPDFGINIIDATTSMVSERFVYTPQNNGLYPRSALETRRVQKGSYQTDLVKGSADKHAIYLDPRSCTFYEVYKQFSSPRTGPTFCRGAAGSTCTAMSGIAYSGTSYALPTGSVQASNLLYFPTLVRATEIHSGTIPHALEFTASLGSIKAGTPYWPANSILGCAASVCPNSPPYGARFRLKPDFDISNFSKNAQVILTALKQYGMFLSDVGTGGAVVYADTDTTQDQAIIAAFGEIGNAHLLMTAFDAVDESSFIVNTRSSQVNPNNPYQSPRNSAVVTAAPDAGNQVSVPVALVPQAPGTSASALFIIAGTPAYALDAWVGGSANSLIEWRLVSGPGSVTREGMYTAPTQVTAATKAILEFGPCASPGVISQVAITVLPASADGGIRIDAGSSTPTTTPDGKRWLADTAFEGADDKFRGDYPKWQPQTDPNIAIYQTFHYTGSDDLTYSLIVPNGNYKARLMMGAPYNGHSTAITYDPLVYWSAWGPYNLIANGKIINHNYDPGISTAHRCGVPSDAYLPVSVTDNRLSLSIRGNRPDALAGLPLIMPAIEGIEIVPDAATPYLTIDSQQQTSVAGGSTLQLYAVGWYMDNAVTWGLVASPGAIDATGLYTAPAATSSPQTVIVQATSQVNGHVAATITLTVPGQ